MLTRIPFIVAAALTLGASSMIYHPGSYPTLRLQRISNKDLSATHSGYAMVHGRIEAHWENREDGTFTGQEYLLIPDAAAVAKLPTLDDYRPTEIGISNGREALIMAVGRDAASAFDTRETLRVSIVGTFKITQLALGIECGQLYAGARVESVSGPGQLALDNSRAPIHVC